MTAQPVAAQSLNALAMRCLQLFDCDYTVLRPFNNYVTTVDLFVVVVLRPELINMSA